MQKNFTLSVLNIIQPYFTIKNRELEIVYSSPPIFII